MYGGGAVRFLYGGKYQLQSLFIFLYGDGSNHSPCLDSCMGGRDQSQLLFRFLYGGTGPITALVKILVFGEGTNHSSC